MQTSIRPCTCANAYQDGVYGPGLRVHNAKTKTPGWRCTSCGRETHTGAKK
jgi:hypothetical protein